MCQWLEYLERVKCDLRVGGKEGRLPPLFTKKTAGSVIQPLKKIVFN